MHGQVSQWTMAKLPAQTVDRLLLAGLGLTLATWLAAFMAARLHHIPYLTVRGAMLAFLVLLGLRLGRGVGQVLGGELPWGRLLLPGLIFIEGVEALVHTGPGWLWAKAATVVVLELAILVAAAQVWRHPAQGAGQWPEEQLATRLEGFLAPRLARVLSVELVILAGALRFLAGGWRRQAAAGGFSYHRESTLGALLMALPVMVLADLLLMEVLLRRLSPWIRWTVHGLDLYGLLWVVGFWASLRLRPHRISAGMVHLHRGVVGRATFPLAQVADLVSVPPLLEGEERRAFLGGAAPFGARGGPEVLVKLSEPFTPIGLFGARRPLASAVVAVDDAQAFLGAFRTRG